MIDLNTRAVAPFFPDAHTFHNIYKLQKHVLLRHQSYLIVFMGNKNFTILADNSPLNKHFCCVWKSYMSWSFLEFIGLRWEVIVHFVDIGGIVYHHCLDFLFIIQCHQKHFPLTGVFKCIPVCLKPSTKQVNMTFYVMDLQAD